MGAHFSSKKADWRTPPELVAEWRERYPFLLDVCATHGHQVCGNYISPEEDALKIDWLERAPNKLAWMNPPYGKEIGPFVARAKEYAKKGMTVVCLLPSRTDTRWWHANVQPILDGDIPGEVHFLKGRIKFRGASAGAPFPSVIVVFKP
jgi:site-specific DNA-methyltransferase (adenine-specific)